MKILYFASLKENLNTSDEDLDFKSPVKISTIKKELIQKYGEHHFPKNILCAVNQEIASEDTLVNEADEVAFFPPVTGG
ncbi:MAG: molybdopterin converting factor subunit 1 [Candidatus Pseudothioglobus sp.]|jgi:molybdopterin synthase sulfur carrier subunit|tara:strand:- start:9 stop:245 length:237 start_codon:yes stop_codon:yes gene_type:complete